jgi:hypothetical protein
MLMLTVHKEKTSPLEVFAEKVGKFMEFYPWLIRLKGIYPRTCLALATKMG